ncbi:hypothetical protein IAQ61_007133 [Plenodomus lingam]|uniref:RING-type domain-containing protein n=1 Tax=Leptosphaeria maculans (strain JN3 / isolate v23.1.3 / race Av1-4-5-6-7-8) TaxID=985895 RepID=E5A1J6_LEPMJ|nr:hypothetical protein LEMA_P105910.1 [Plenodomus lingam JN3]KAH9867829.1 hypothetical protein IAQ61_007133 [Plenodomus lingam]CBX97460.1 hypothetical protein LEMA_P105910.1 [Plenodomus lingam JN3]
MGTLTGDVPRLDSHCPHKLATSCRLTATPNCCACADERPHSQTYRVYIDGVGFVQRGTRWQGYCWFCKEFWTNRLAATDPPLEISQTRIPDVPDQTEFLARWNEFYQGYQIETLADGTEQWSAVLGERFSNVSPGFLPRTRALLEAGVRNDARRPGNRFARGRLPEEESQPEAPHQNIEDSLDRLLQQAADPEDDTWAMLQETVRNRSNNWTVVHEGRTVSARLWTSLQEEEILLASTYADEIPEMNAPEPPRPFTRQDAQLLRRREHFRRLFGSREDVQREDYESPVAAMYSRADARYRQAEERRAVAPVIGDDISVQERREIEEQLLWGVMQDSQAMSESLEREGDVWSYTPVPVVDQLTVPEDSVEDVPLDRTSPSIEHLTSFVEHIERMSDAFGRPGNPPTTTPSTTAATNPSLTATSSSSPLATTTPATQPTPRHPSDLSDIRTSLAHMTSELARLRLVSSNLATARRNPRVLPQPSPSLDNQPDRPPPATDAEMTKLLACQVCYQQLADTALLPCGHMVMCRWCADVVVPVRHAHIPVGVVKCPMCRKVVKQRFKIHM